MPRTPREVAEQVRQVVAGEVVFADLFAADGVLAYPFAVPGVQPQELRGRDAIRAFFAKVGQSGQLFDMEGVDAVIRETEDPEVVVTEITHYGRSLVTGAPYRLPALGVIRVRDGEIVQYDDYMNPVALARLLGRTAELTAALAST
jgi:ketosteroid isomerase-like protein